MEIKRQNYSVGSLLLQVLLLLVTVTVEKVYGEMLCRKLDIDSSYLGGQMFQVSSLLSLNFLYIISVGRRS